MKKIKIFTGIILFLLILICISPKSEAAGNVSLTSNKSNVYIGDEFIISINVSGMSIATLTTRITVDTSKVDYISGPSNSNFSSGRVIYTWTDPNGGASPITGGTIATFRFRAKQSGTVNFSISGDFYDSNENVISPGFSGTNVKISEVTNNDNGGEENVGGGDTGGNQGGDSKPPENTGDTTKPADTTKSSNANLKSLQLNQEGITPSFSKLRTQYYLVVSNIVSAINVTAKPEDNNAKVSISGNNNLKIGLNKILITVTAPDNKTKKTYTINVTKTENPEKANSRLENLAIENATLNPEFNPEVFEYISEIQTNENSVNLLAIPQNQNAKVSIKGNENLQIGENDINITVTAEDGVSVKTYFIKLNKQDVIENELNEQEDINDSAEELNKDEKANRIKRNIWSPIIAIMVGTGLITGYIIVNKKRLK